MAEYLAGYVLEQVFKYQLIFLNGIRLLLWQVKALFTNGL
jgi:hypothetical protein